jgi:hypothetical protein
VAGPIDPELVGPDDEPPASSFSDLPARAVHAIDPVTAGPLVVAPPPATATRSSIPLTIGILAIVFSTLGLGAALISVGAASDARHSHIGVLAVASLVVSALHLAGGILACAGRRIGLRLLTVYGIAALVLAASEVIWTAASATPVDASIAARKFHMMWTVFTALFTAAWAVVVLALVNTKAARAATR